MQTHNHMFVSFIRVCLRDRMSNYSGTRNKSDGTQLNGSIFLGGDVNYLRSKIKPKAIKWKADE